MAKQALVITNIEREQPGSILDILAQRGWMATIVNLNADRDAAAIFPTPKNFDAMIVMGGPPSANDLEDVTPWMPLELQKIKEALNANIPYLGVCLGMQTLVKAAGGVIIPSPRKEVGLRDSYGDPLGNFYSVRLTENGKKDPFFKGIPDSFPLFHLHGETVDISGNMNPEAVLLATDDAVPNQIVRVGKNAYGTQGHFELTNEMLNIWLQQDPDLKALGEKGMEQLKKDFLEVQTAYTKNAKQMYTNFLTLAESK